MEEKKIEKKNENKVSKEIEMMQNLIKNLLLKTEQIKSKEDLIVELRRKGKIKFVNCNMEAGKKTIEPIWQLKEGTITPVYIDMRLAREHDIINLSVITQYIKIIKENNLEFDCIGGVPDEASGPAGQIALFLEKPYIGIRKNGKKGHGVETGNISFGTEDKKNKKVLLIEGTTDSQRSINEIALKLREEGFIVEKAVVFMNREYIGEHKSEDAKVKLYSVTTLSETMKILQKHKKELCENKEKILPYDNTYEVIQKFIESPDNFTTEFEPYTRRVEKQKQPPKQQNGQTKSYKEKLSSCMNLF